MPKNRKRVMQKGAKSESIRTKHKIGGRKSSKGVKQMSLADMEAIAATCRPRDRFKLCREGRNRVILSVVASSG
jgi:hypothetical protein